MTTRHPQVTQQITFLYTNNLEQSAQFYENTFGFRLWRDQGTCRIYELRQGALLGICQVSITSKGQLVAEEQQNIIFTIVSDDVDDWYTHLQEHGVAFEKPPQFNENYGIYHFFLRDPDGYLIEIQRFLNT